MGWAALGGGLSGAISTGTIEGALWGAFAAMAFVAAGQTFTGSLDGGGVAGSNFTAPELARASVAHGVTGGTISKLQGGRFGHGFLSAGVTKLFSPAIQNAGGSNYAQGAKAAIFGGTVFRISGRKFASGAVAAAMAYAFNSMSGAGGGRGGTGPDFDSMSNQEIADWLKSNASTFGVEIADEVSVLAVDGYIDELGRPCSDALCGGRLDVPVSGCT